LHRCDAAAYEQQQRDDAKELLAEGCRYESVRTLDSGWRVLSAPQDEAYSVVFDMPVNANS
jgi:hypothetical protein